MATFSYYVSTSGRISLINLIICMLAIGTRVSLVSCMRILVKVTLSLFLISCSKQRAWKLF